MDLSLDDEFQSFIDAKVKAGEFVNAQEVIETALGFMRAWEESLGTEDRARLADMRQLCAEAEADVHAGRVEDWDLDKMKREFRARAAAGNRKRKVV